MEPLALALFLAGLNKQLLDFIATAIKRRYENADLWWFDLVSLVTGFALGWFSQANVLPENIMIPTVGRIITCLMIGAGTNIINQLMGGQALPSAAMRKLEGPGDDKLGKRGW